MSHVFCRLLLKETMTEVRKHTTAEQRKKAWTYKYDAFRDHCEFHGPDGFYWHGTACCLWEARANGWQTWLESKGYVKEDN